MASSSATVKCEGGIIRKYGGTRREVRSMKEWYENMSEGEFFERHPHLSEKHFTTLRVETRFNKG